MQISATWTGQHFPQDGTCSMAHLRVRASRRCDLGHARVGARFSAPWHRIKGRGNNKGMYGKNLEKKCICATHTDRHLLIQRIRYLYLRVLAEEIGRLCEKNRRVPGGGEGGGVREGSGEPPFWSNW